MEVSDVINVIESKKEKELKYYSNIIDEVKGLSKNDVAVLYHSLYNIFRNNYKQSDYSGYSAHLKVAGSMVYKTPHEILIKLLKENLTDNFFKTAYITDTRNNIIFYNTEFEIWFPTDVFQIIEVYYERKIEIPYYNSIIPKNYTKIIELLEEYLNNKSFKRLKEVVNEYYSNNKNIEYNQNIRSKIRRYIRAYKQYNIKYLNKLKQTKERDLINKQKYIEKLKQLEEEDAYIKEFIESLTDLKQFKAIGYEIIIKKK